MSLICAVVFLAFASSGDNWLAAQTSGIDGESGQVQQLEPEENRSKGINFLVLLSQGGWFMLPLTLLSILVVCLAIERTLALRRDKIMPRRLVSELGRMAADEGEFNPRRAFQLCQKFPSPTAKIVQTMLIKAGRPQSEIDHAVSEAGQREANRLQSMVSWLTLAAAVAPLIGLLGTVWGITQAFYVTTTLSAMENKGAALAEGIYTALVTTMFGLSIAIPAAILAHIFENRIIKWCNQIDELVLNLTPQLEPFEGRVRASFNGETHDVPGARAANPVSAPSLPR
ncbi:MAG TPA: MotA/TolQ/ExbB proton channel family protein [Pirellulaceae bacterium]|nr:MotA/TolQ/ExbB proton channel family protein [Pirellulaceae bacterium]